MENPQKFCRKFKDVSLEELRNKVAEFAKVRNWDQYHSPRNLLLALVSYCFNKLVSGVVYQLLTG